MKIFVLQHEHGLDGAAKVKLIGVYGSESDARQARERVARLPGFVEHQEGFSIDEYEIGRDHWTAGFVEARPDVRRSPKVSAPPSRRVAVPRPKLAKRN